MRYAIYNKDGFLGTFGWDGNKEVVDSEDEVLLKLLKAPYTTLGSLVTEDERATIDVTYQPNTKEHFDVLVIEMDKFGFEAIEL